MTETPRRMLDKNGREHDEQTEPSQPWALTHDCSKDCVPVEQPEPPIVSGGNSFFCTDCGADTPGQCLCGLQPETPSDEQSVEDVIVKVLDFGPLYGGSFRKAAADILAALRDAGYVVVKDGTIGTVAQDAHEAGAAEERARIESDLRGFMAAARAEGAAEQKERDLAILRDGINSPYDDWKPKDALRWAIRAIEETT